MAESPALIVTAKLDPETFRLLDELRRKHFPPERNFLAAHVTLFHKLPGEEIRQIESDLEQKAEAANPIAAEFPALRFLGRGVAVDIESPGLVGVRSQLAFLWSRHLSPQDRQGFRPHVTIQNKVEPAQAKELFESLRSALTVPGGRFIGFELWHYEGGPWRLEAEFPFTGKP
jgi:hypothetical protein